MPNFQSLKSQQGIAVILVMLLVGVAITASSLGIIHSMRSAQEKQVAVHAITHSQNGAWTGVEAMRMYLESLTDTQTLEGIGSSFEINVSGYGTLNANGVSIDYDGNSDTYTVNANIVNTNVAAKSSSSVGVVYSIATPSCPGCIELSAALDFHDDLEVSGGITFNMSSAPVINVDGDITMLNVGISSLGALSATGSVTLDSQVHADTIFSNDDVSLTGSANADLVRTRGNLTTGGGGGATVVSANGNVAMMGTFPSDEVNTRGNATVGNQGIHAGFLVNGSMEIQSSGTTVGDIQVRGDITIDHDEVNVGNAIGEGDLICPADSWTDFTSISINGSFGASCDTTTAFTDKATDGASNTVPTVAEVPVFNMPRMTVDVWELRTYANYVIEYDSGMNRTKITVRNINNVPDGVYYLGNYSTGTHNSYLCQTFTDGGSCLTPATPLSPMCLGHSIHNDCLFYDSATSTWSFNGKNAAPGIMWFDGNVLLDNGTNFATILAAGDVSTGGSFRGYSVNYAAYNGVCLATGDGVDATYTSIFIDNYPTNLCNFATGKYIPIDVGNVAIAAGGYDPADSGTFSGGDITLGASNRVYGIVLAGNYLHTGGETVVHGYVTAAVQGTQGVDDNKLGGSTTINLNNLPSTYDPNIVPDMRNGTCPDCDYRANKKINGATVQWSRYL